MGNYVQLANKLKMLALQGLAVECLYLQQAGYAIKVASDLSGRSAAAENTRVLFSAGE